MMTPKLRARRKEQEAGKMGGILLQLETSIQLVKSWGGSEAAVAQLEEALSDARDACLMLEAEAEAILDGPTSERDMMELAKEHREIHGDEE